MKRDSRRAGRKTEPKVVQVGMYANGKAELDAYMERHPKLSPEMIVNAAVLEFTGYRKESTACTRTK